MTNCRNCGCVLQPTDTFCPACGKDLASQAPAPPLPEAVFTPAETSTKATISLICGILFFILPSALVAIIAGHMALSEIKRSAGRITGEGRAVVGLILGYFGLVCIPFIAIIAALAIPNLLRARMVANETTALSSVRTLNVAEVSYATAYPNIGYTCDLGKLSAEGPNSKPLIDTRLASGLKYGYRFELSGCMTAAQAGTDVEISEADVPFGVAENAVRFYRISAYPVKPGNTGRHTYCSDQTGVIRSIESGSPEDCFTSGTPLS